MGEGEEGEGKRKRRWRNRDLRRRDGRAQSSAEELTAACPLWVLLESSGPLVDVVGTLMPSLPPVNKAACECFMGWCLKMNEAGRYRGFLSGQGKGYPRIPTGTERAREHQGQVPSGLGICPHLGDHTSGSTVPSSGSPGLECATFPNAVAMVPEKK